MADSLTQLQDCLDDLLTQMYGSLTYIHTRHPYGEIPGQPSQAPQPAPQDNTANGAPPSANGTNAASQQPATASQNEAPATPAPEPPDVFNATLHVLAQELVNKEQQIEIIVRALPGIGNSEAAQERRLRELEAELRQVEEERARKELEKQNMVDLLGEVIGKVKRVP